MHLQPVESAADMVHNRESDPRSPQQAAAAVPAIAAPFPQSIPAPIHQRSRVWTWLTLVVLAGGAWFSRGVWLPLIPRGTAGEKAGAAKPPPRPVPVRVATVVQHEMPEYLS